MFRGTRVFARGVALTATALRRSAAAHQHAHHATSTAATESATPTPAATSAASEPNSKSPSSLEHAQDTSNASVQPHIDQQPAPPPPSHGAPKFLFKGRRGSAESEYYMTRSSAGHPDAAAVLLNSGRADPEWMWLKLLCFLCVSATIGTTLYGYFFPKHVKYFKDEPWSPFTY